MIVYRIIPILLGGLLAVYTAKHPVLRADIKVYIIVGILVITLNAVLKVEKIIDKLEGQHRRQYGIVLCGDIDSTYYEQERGFIIEDVRIFDITKIGNVFYSDNYFQGNYKGVEFRQADVIINSETCKVEDNTVTKYFDGRMFEFKSDKSNVQNVKVFSKGYDSRLDVNDDRVDFEDLLFNDTFDVYAPDPAEVQEILTNEMIEHLLILQNRNRSIGFRFAKGVVYVGVNGTRPFDIEAKNKICYDRELAIAKQEIQITLDLIEGLGLVKE